MVVCYHLFAIFAKNIEYELGRDIRGLASFATSVGKGQRPFEP